MSTHCFPLDADELLKLDNQLCFALYSASLAMTKAYKPLLENLGLTYPQYLVMLILWQQDGITLREIAERMLMDSGALTPVLKRLEQQGLVTRRRVSGNERALEICVTEQGSALKQQAAAVVLQIGSSCALELNELTSLRQQLVQLRKQLTASE